MKILFQEYDAVIKELREQDMMDKPRAYDREVFASNPIKCKQVSTKETRKPVC
jgi:hypothetical protein